jgi:uncharacterized protein with HEPN domain
MSNRSAELLIEDILDAARKIQRFTIGITFEDFIADDKTVDAVVRNFEVIGEASNRLPPEFKQRYAEVDWARIKGFRNRIVHDYFGIDHIIVWNIIQHYLPRLIETLSTRSEQSD